MPITAVLRPSALKAWLRFPRTLPEANLHEYWRDLDAILTAGPTAVEAVGFTITDRSEGGWTATFEGQHDYEDRMATLECRVNVGTLDGMPVIWARYHEKRDPKRIMSKEQALAILRYKRI